MTNTSSNKKVGFIHEKSSTFSVKKVVLFLRTKYRGSSDSPQRLAIEGIAPAPITPEPDAAEQAAAALLDSFVIPHSSFPTLPFRGLGGFNAPLQGARGLQRSPSGCSGAYYAAISHRIREARAMEERACLRWLTYCEQQLQTHPLTHPVMEGSAGAVNTSGARPSPSTGEREEGLLLALQQGLYDRQDIAYRAGGTLLRRWQHCLAEVTMRLMAATENENQNENQNYSE